MSTTQESEFEQEYLLFQIETGYSIRMSVSNLRPHEQAILYTGFAVNRHGVAVMYNAKHELSQYGYVKKFAASAYSKVEVLRRVREQLRLVDPNDIRT